jgi:hypothetical protein
MLVIKSNIVVGEAEGLEPMGEMKVRVGKLRLYTDVLWPGRRPDPIRKWNVQFLLRDALDYMDCIIEAFASTPVKPGNTLLLEDVVLRYSQTRLPC